MAKSNYRRQNGGGFEGSKAGPDFKLRCLPERRKQWSGYLREYETTILCIFRWVLRTPWLPGKHRMTKPVIDDFVNQCDAVVGQIMALEEIGQADNTLLIMTSDNGSHWVQVIFPSTITEPIYITVGKSGYLGGGHRVPFIARWPSGTGHESDEQFA